MGSLQVPQNTAQQSNNKEPNDCIINHNNSKVTAVIINIEKETSDNIIKADVINDSSVSETSCSGPYKDVIFQEYNEEETFM